MSQENNQCFMDARYLTDYRPSADSENINRVTSESQNNFEYRMFLQRNGKNIMKKNLNNLDEFFGCGPFENTMLNEQSKQVCNEEECFIEPHDPNGLGVGRFYTNKKECIYKLKSKK